MVSIQLLFILRHGKRWGTITPTLLSIMIIRLKNSKIHAYGIREEDLSAYGSNYDFMVIPSDFKLRKNENGTIDNTNPLVHASLEERNNILVQTAELKLRYRRKEIAGNDNEILETTQDATALLMYFVASLVISIQKAKDFSDLQVLLNDSELTSIADTFLQEIKQGKVKLAPILKGQSDVINQIKQRFSKAAEVFENQRCEHGCE